MSKKKLEQGLDELLAAATPQEQPQDERQTYNYQTVCYNLHPDLVDNIKKVAKYEGKRANEVVTDALRFYFAQWKPIPQEKPTLAL